VNITDTNFEQEVLKSDVPVLVDFWAPWCPPCRAMSPVIDALATEYSGKVKIGKLNVDDNPVTSSRFQVRSIPAFLLFKDGKIVNQTVGSQPAASMRRMLDPVAAKPVTADVSQSR
jgi:thioredoxin 1